MGYYEKEIQKINFYGIQYREINDINDYLILKKEINDLFKNIDKNQGYITAKNSYKSAEKEKEKSLVINFSIAVSILFGLYGFDTELIFSTPKSVLGIILCFAGYIFLVMFISAMIITRANKILKVRNNEINFFEVICEIIKEEQ